MHTKWYAFNSTPSASWRKKKCTLLCVSKSICALSILLRARILRFCECTEKNVCNSKITSEKKLKPYRVERTLAHKHKHKHTFGTRRLSNGICSLNCFFLCLLRALTSAARPLFFAHPSLPLFLAPFFPILPMRIHSENTIAALHFAWMNLSRATYIRIHFRFVRSMHVHCT